MMSEQLPSNILRTFQRSRGAMPADSVTRSPRPAVQAAVLQAVRAKLISPACVKGNYKDICDTNVEQFAIWLAGAGAGGDAPESAAPRRQLPMAAPKAGARENSNRRSRVRNTTPPTKKPPLEKRHPFPHHRSGETLILDMMLSHSHHRRCRARKCSQDLDCPTAAPHPLPRPQLRPHHRGGRARKCSQDPD